MLSRPEYGWTHFQLGNDSYRLSFLTDVAFDWLTQAIHGLKTMDVFSVHGFSEPGRMICTVSYWSCYIIFEDEGPAPGCEGVSHLHVSMIDFCKKLCHDIDAELDAWVHWDEEEPDCADREKKLRSLLDELKTLIDEREADFDGGLFF